MPITFNRIDTLLRDLETSINCFDALRRAISGILSASHFDAQSKLSMISSELTQCAKPPRALAEYERRYYNANKKRNERTKEKQRQRRRRKGLPERDTALPSVIMTEMEVMKEVDNKGYEIPEGETHEQREERALILAHDRTIEIFKARGAFPRSALVEFAMGINRQVEQLVEDLLNKDWLDSDDGRNYFPLDRTTGEVIAQNAKAQQEETTDVH